MYKYLVCNEPDEAIFNHQCAVLETHIAGLQKVDFLNDVDGGMYAVYQYGDKRIIIKHSQYLGAVYIDSEI